MKNRRHILLILGAVLLILAALAACGPAAEEGAAPADGEEVAESADCPEVECPELLVDVVPFEAAWAGSPHADDTAAAFNHWNEDDPAEVEQNCAKCHSTSGMLDFLGADGTEAGVVDGPAEIGQVITCEACHNDASVTLDSVVFPSGAEITNVGDAAICMQCHQGRASGATVDGAIAELGLEGSLDTPSEELGFINIHYYAAAATLFGSEAHSGYEYAGKRYQIRFDHVEGYQTCTDCHDQHTLELKVESCADCHEGADSNEAVLDIRMNGSLADYDGDGDAEEGIYYEVEGLRTMLYEAIQAYAAEVVGTPIVYAHAYPYFFIDTNGDGEASEDEAAFPNKYNAFTPRLLAAAYNYQAAGVDPGAFVHNAKYHIALMYDSTESLNEALSSPVDLASARRDDAGHFDGTAEAFRHWDEDGAVPGRCSRCHSGSGLPTFLAEGVNISAAPANGFACTTCHSELGGEWALYPSDTVPFPSGASVTFGEGEGSNLCLNCHQGRESTVSVNDAIARAGVGNDAVSDALSFRNPHYFAAGATLFGTETKGGYEYAGKTYAGRNEHVSKFDTCAECHNVHALEVDVNECSDCHEGSLEEIRVSEDDVAVDYDGDGDVEEGVKGEIETMHEILLAEILNYAATRVGTPIAYDPYAYPYFFTDTNGNGAADPDEANFGNRYVTFTPNLLRATYNYQYVAKDPGAFAHNSAYSMELLYDSIQSLNPAATAGMTRP